MIRVITYECTQCGCEITVSQTGESVLMPIYCCGVEVSETSAHAGKKADSRKKNVRNLPRKAAKKVVAGKASGKTVQTKKKAAPKKSSKK